MGALTPSTLSNADVSQCVYDCRDPHVNDFVTKTLSKLNYVLIRIQGTNDIHYAFHNNRSEINVFQRNLRQKLTQLPSMGRVKIKGVIGPAVETDIVLLNVSPVATVKNCKNIAPPLREIFAFVYDELNERIILAVDSVRRLAALENY